MNREIRFRAWDGKTMDEFTLDTIYWRGEETGDYDFPRNVEVMQYTGLKDKNGVEIYEGDILKRLAPTQGTARHTTVVWRAAGAGVGFNLRAPANTTQLRTMVVIGNIHENGDLLK